MKDCELFRNFRVKSARASWHDYGNGFEYNGAYCFRVQDGNAQGAFSMVRHEKDSGLVIGILPYMVQGIRFVH